MNVQETPATESTPQTALETADVLVIDDSDQLLQVLDEVLTMQGFTVRTANSAQAAFDCLNSSRPDIILCDIMMPEIDGFRFHSEIKKNPEWCDIPFLFVSALSDPEEVRFGKQLGCDEYVTKPFDPIDLAATIRGKVAIAKIRQDKQKDSHERFRKRVIHTLSHEFRTPLVAINTGTELLLEQHEQLDPPRFERLLESIQRGGLRLQRLVEDFMTLQQIESGAAASIAQRFKRNTSIRKVVELAIENFRDQVRGEQCDIVFQQPEDASPAMIAVYDVQVVNIIQRLISNALKFAGGAKPVVISMAVTNTTGSIFVRDFGPGLSEAIAQEACELFKQINRERIEQQGCGIGLSISRCFASLNGGELHFSSPTDGGEGLQVELRFPLAN
ncbi:MAG: hybrid sensor histidine kinase/response regulator [Deltaproteobacteria bacterium]|nr:hybrid sensor histidine kinase/response regulator [Deltaproteobacteria bacterium]